MNMDDLPDSALDGASERIVNVEGAVTQLAKVVGLELVDIYLDQGGEPDEETAERLAEIAGSLITIAGVSVDLLKDIAPLAGINIHMNGGAPRILEPGEELQHPQEKSQLALPAPADIPTVTDTTEAEELVAQSVAEQTSRSQSPEESTKEDARPEEESSSEVDAKSDFYKRLAKPESFAQVKPAEGAPLVKAEITGDEKLKIGAETIQLKGDQLYLFNAMLTLRDQPRSAAQLKQFGFAEGVTPGTANTRFSNNVRSLIDRVNRVAGVELLKKVGERRQTRYIVNPNLLIEDLRISEVDSDDDLGDTTGEETVSTETESNQPQADKKIDFSQIDPEEIPEEATTLQIMALAYQDDDYVQKRIASKYRPGNSRINPANDMVGRYLQEAGRYDLLTAEEEQDLAREIRTGLEAQAVLDEDPNLATPELVKAVKDAVAARQLFVLCNMRLVINIAKKSFDSPKFGILDRIQEGNIGLMRAIETFDPDQGYKFSTYATWWVRQGITRALGDKSRTIRLPVHIHEKVVKVTTLRRKAEMKLSREATFEEIAEESEGKFTTEGVKHLLHLANMDPGSISQPLYRKSGAPGSSGDEVMIEDFLAGDADRELENYIKQLDDMEDIALMLAHSGLSDREKTVLSLRFSVLFSELVGKKIETADGKKVEYGELFGQALMTDKGMTLEEAGDTFGVTRERIRQIQVKAIDTMRKKAGLRYATD